MIRILAALVLAAFAFAAHAAIEANNASQAELETIKGIGPGLSTKILDARKSGEFKNWDDLVERVNGVGPGNAARFSQAGLTVGSAAYSSARQPAAAKTSPGTRAPAKAEAGAAKPATGR
jgi:competence protein ComEA